MRITVLQFQDNYSERISFWKSKGVTVFDRDLTEINNYDVIFIHTSDETKLDVRQKQNILAFKGWKLRYSGDENVKVSINADKKEVAILSWDMIENNYDRFEKNITSKPFIEGIWELMNFDKKLEHLLEEFKTVLPLKEYWIDYLKTNDLCESKRQLHIHIKSPINAFKCM